MERFEDLLSEAIYRIQLYQGNKPVAVIQDELGYALGREGGSAIAYWRKGHIPKAADLEKLAREIVHRSDLEANWLRRFLACAAYPHVETLVQALFPQTVAASAMATSTVGSVPEQSLLPIKKSYTDLIGRDVEVHELLSKLSDPTASPFIGIDGIDGIGKTALLYEVAQQARKRHLFDTLLWVDVANDRQREANALTFAGLISLLAQQLGLTNPSHPAEEELLLRLRTVLQNRRVLLVLDNLEAAGQLQDELIRQLLPFLGLSRALLASRQRFVGHHYALHLAGLDFSAVRAFIRQEANALGLLMGQDASEPEVQQIFAATGGSPLALKLVISQLSFLPLEIILSQLQTGNALPGYGADDKYHALYVRIFMQAWHSLSTAGQRLLLAMSLFVPGIGVNSEVLRSISGLLDNELFLAINELWRLSLLEAGGPQNGALSDKRYYLHALTQNFIRTAILEARSGTLALSSDLTQYYLTAAQNFVHYFLQLAQQAQQKGLLVADEQFENIVKALHLAHAHHWADRLAHGANDAYPLLARRGLFEQANVHLQRAELIARQYTDRALLLETLLHRGQVEQRLGHPEVARLLLVEGLDVAEQTHLLEAAARLHQELAHLLSENELDDAVAHLDQALAYARKLALPRLLATLLADRLWLAILRADDSDPTSWVQEALVLLSKQNDPALEMLLQGRLGVALSIQMRVDEAVHALSESLRLARSLHDTSGICFALQFLGVASMYQGRFADAERELMEAHKLARQIGLAWTACSVLGRLGEMASWQGNYPQARHYLDEGLRLADQYADMLVEARRDLFTLYADWAMRQNLLFQAELYLERAMPLAYLLDRPYSLGRTLLTYGHLRRQKLEWVAAEYAYNEALATTLKGKLYLLAAQAQIGLGQIAYAQGDRDKGAALVAAGLAVLDRAKDILHATETRRWLAAFDQESGQARG